MSGITDKDKSDWKNFIEGNEPLANKDISQNNKFKIEKFKSLDLHGYSLDEANKIVSNFIKNCFDEGVSKINIVTGKGSRSNNVNDPYKSKDLALLKYSVPEFIINNSELMNKIKRIDIESVESPIKGSFDIFLKKN